MEVTPRAAPASRGEPLALLLMGNNDVQQGKGEKPMLEGSLFLRRNDISLSSSSTLCGHNVI